MVAEHVVATVDDASVAMSVIVYVPGAAFTICVVLVLPLLQRNETGAMPPEDVAAHVTAVADGVPVHEAVSSEAALAVAAKNINNAPEAIAIAARAL